MRIASRGIHFPAQIARIPRHQKKLALSQDGAYAISLQGESTLSYLPAIWHNSSVYRPSSTYSQANRYMNDTQPFLALNNAELVDALMQDARLLSVEDRSLFPQLTQLINTGLYIQGLSIWQDLKNLYHPFDPDRDSPHHRNSKKPRDTAGQYQRFVDLFSSVVTNAHYIPLPTCTKSGLITSSFTLFVLDYSQIHCHLYFFFVF